jgi:hypothetical protein
MSGLRPEIPEYLRPVTFFSDGVDREELRKEIFFLAYHLHWSWSDLMDMDVEERRTYTQLLMEQIERENSQVRAARRA